MKSPHSLEILFEDQWIIVVGKPSGMLSVGFPGNRSRTAEKILEDMHRGRGKVKIGAVHRLDRDTSGVMMFACTEEARTRIMDEWQDMVSERIYRCVCSRNPDASALPDSGTIDAPLAYNRSDVAFVPRKGDAKALKDAEKAVTHFRVLERGPKYDLVECELETGRKNQIRAHMAHLGHPVIGDEVYGEAGGHPGGDRAQSESPIGRLALHARVLAFTHPFTGAQHRFEIPEPDTFEKIVKRGSRTPGAKSPVAKAQGQSPKMPGSRQSRSTGEAADDAAFGAGTEKKLPRRQRGKHAPTDPKHNAKAQKYPRDGFGGKERDVEDLTDLKALPRKSRTRQVTGKSRFIPGK